jgi:acyl carrier protein
MGLDFVEITMNCEKEFGITLDTKQLSDLARYAPYRKSWFERGTHDILVDDFVQLIEKTIQQQKPGPESNIFERVKTVMADCLAVDEAEITLDSWLIQDLNMY